MNYQMFPLASNLFSRKEKYAGEVCEEEWKEAIIYLAICTYSQLNYDIHRKLLFGDI